VQVSGGFPVSKRAAPAADALAGDAVSALLTLGYKRGEAEKAIQHVRADATETLTVEGLLKEALKQLGR
jgi:Holliday junction DNA helicase RuvA